MNQNGPGWHNEPPTPVDKVPTRDEVFGFLNALRDSGVTNMFGAAPYIREEFGINRYEANRFLVQWMDSFKRD